MPLVKMRGDVRELSESSGGSLESELFEADPLVHLNSPFADEVSSPEIGHDVFDALEAGDYDEEQGAPSSKRPWMPWAAVDARTWTDAHVMLFGRVAEIAFAYTRKECLRRARRAKSPYREHGLDAPEADDAEKRRIEKQKQRAIPDILGQVMPDERGAHTLRPLGYVCRRVKDGITDLPRADSYMGLNLVFEVRPGETVMVQKQKMDLLMQFVSKAFPTARRDNRISYRKAERRHAPVEVYLEGLDNEEEMDIVAEKLEIAPPPQTLIGMVMPITAAAERAERGVWERLPEDVREGTLYGHGQNENSASENRAQKSVSQKENSLVQGELFGG